MELAIIPRSKDVALACCHGIKEDAFDEYAIQDHCQMRSDYLEL